MADARAPEVVGVVLAGGRSQRMGRDKALLPFGDMTLLEHQVQLLHRSGACDRVVASGERDGLPSIPDRRAGRGPLGALDADGESGAASLKALAAALAAEALPRPPGSRERFGNLNTPDDYEACTR